MNISDRDLDPTRRDRGASSLGDDPTPGTEAGAGGVAEAAGLPKVDELVDEIMPEEVDWQRLVRSYPIPALLLAAGAGFFLAVRRGPLVVGALSGWAAGEMTRRVNEILGDDVF